MPECLNCGEPVGASATACSACGASLEGVTEATGGQPAEGQPGQGRQPNQQSGGGQPRQAPQGGQPNRRAQGGQSNQPPGDGQPNQPPGDGQPNRQPGGGQPGGQPQGGHPHGGQPHGGQPHGGQPQGGQPQGGQPAQQPQGGQQPPQGQHPQGGQAYQQPSGGQQYQQGGHPPGPPPAGQGGGHSRRTLLKFGGGAAVLGGLGIVGYTMLSGGGGPAGTARSFVNALDSGNVERANQLLHDDSPTGEIGAFTASTLEQVDISIESTEVVSQNAGQAEVRMDLSVESEGEFGGGSSSTVIELRTQNGQWRVWQFN